MTQSEMHHRNNVGSVKGVQLFYGTRVDPSINDVQSFAVILFFPLADGSRVEVAKIDNSEHDETGEHEDVVHLDRYYREEGAEIKTYDIDVREWYEAERHFDKHWERYARTYLDNHGRQHRDR